MWLQHHLLFYLLVRTFLSIGMLVFWIMCRRFILIQIFLCTEKVQPYEATRSGKSGWTYLQRDGKNYQVIIHCICYLNWHHCSCDIDYLFKTCVCYHSKLETWIFSLIIMSVSFSITPQCQYVHLGIVCFFPRLFTSPSFLSLWVFFILFASSLIIVYASLTFGSVCFY